jgi:pimeloyl-ACP methyl ester carboxylesterase
MLYKDKTMPRKISFATHFAVFVAIITALSSADTAHARKNPQNCSVAEHARDAAKSESARFTVQVEGAGPDVILIPGLGTPRDVWDETVTAFAGCYRLHIVQVRGFGDDAGPNASGPVLDPLVAGLGDYIEREIVGKGNAAPAIVGHSMGGLVGLKLAYTRPQSLSRLMMVDSLPAFAVTIPGLGNADVAAIERVALQMREGIIATYGKPANPAAIEATVRSMTLNPKAMENLRIWSAKADARVVAQVVYEDLVTDMRPKLSAIDTPLTVLAAWHDGMPFSEAQVGGFFRGQFAGMKTLSVPTITQSAHFIMLDQPEKFVSALTDFLTQN